MNDLEGANCADLPPFVIDKYFDCDSHRERFYAQVGLAICSHCVVLEACRDQALTMSHLPNRGIIGGTTVGQIRLARRWRLYEAGLTDVVPTGARPEWLPMSDATQTVEQSRLEADPDEPPAERRGGRENVVKRARGVEFTQHQADNRACNRESPT